MIPTDILLAEVQRLRAELDDAHRREAEALRRADAASASLAAARGDVREAIEGMRAELEEQRLTLAAEQGRQEGAPVGWQWDITLGCWRRGQWDMNAVLVDRLGDADDGWGWRLPSERHQNTAPHGIWTARAAMQAADAAQEIR